MRILDSNPYPWPYDDHVDFDRLALLVCGAHTPWMTAGSASTDSATVNIEAMVAALMPCRVTIIATRHAPRPWPRRPSPEEAGPLLRSADLQLNCPGFDAFYASALETELRRRGITHLLVCGYGGEVTVDSTIRTANDRGFECLLVADAVAWLDPRTGAAAASSVTMSGGIFGAVGTTQAVLTNLTLAKEHS
ncbi:MAG: cysteine hydrolase [Acidimicrobiia bacterium]|nr:cysteine hydrolase [Acidimicrobiia bacterium]